MSTTNYRWRRRRQTARDLNRTRGSVVAGPATNDAPDYTRVPGIARGGCLPDMAVNADLSGLVELLSCPVRRSPLTSEPLRLRCRGCGRSFGFEGRVPVFLPGGVRPDRRPTPLARLHSATLGNPWLYDLIQSHVGGRQIVTRVAKELDELRAATVLDVGAGTGMVSGLVPRDARYLWLDNDPLKLRGLLKRPIDCYAVLCDAARLPVADDAVDWTSMIAVSHHLPGPALDVCLGEIARVTRDRFVFVDALRGRRRRSRLLWQLDRGRFPRTEDELVSALSKRFELVRVEHFRVSHDYLLCVGAPCPPSGTGAPG